MRSRLLLALASGGVAAGGGALWRRLRRPVPPVSGIVLAEGTTERVEVLTDRRGVPHLYAGNEKDLLWAQGYTMARERLFQMDFLRRLAAGRLSEVAGDITLDVDRWARLFGLRRTAERAWPHASPMSREALLAFSGGVNGAIREMEERGALPIEFTLLRSAPERWTPVDTLSILRVMALSLSVGWEADLLREGLVALLGEEGAAPAAPMPPLSIPPINEPGLSDLRTLAMGLGGGSNCWVVDGSRSVTGMPLLANDPHLALRLPATWFIQHLECPTLAVAGLALPGVPGILIGHNEHAAWGITAGYSDVQDLYIEERVEREDGALAYRWGDEVLPAELLEERIKVKGRARPVRQQIVLTRHGPLVSSLLRDEARDLALRWTSEEPDDPIASILNIARAATWGAFREALADFGSPPLNFSWAGRDGTIAWIQAGRIPIRQGARGVLPLDGSSGENEWLGYISLDELPQIVNPPEGYIVHANNRPVGESYPHDLGVDFFPGYRAARLSALLAARASHDAASFQAMQSDLYSYPEHRLARLVGRLDNLSPALRDVQQLLSGWDGQMEEGSSAAALAHLLFHRVRHLLVSDELAHWSARWQGKVHQPALQNLLPHAFCSWAWVLERVEEPQHPWWRIPGDPPRAGRDALLEEALVGVVEGLREQWGEAPASVTWGRLHRRRIEHPLGSAPLLGRLLNRGPFPMAGGPFSPNPDLSTVHAFQQIPPVGASARIIADLSDWDNYLVALAGGNSGHPASPHYADGLDGWRRGEHQPLPWSRAEVEREARGVLVLAPAGA